MVFVLNLILFLRATTYYLADRRYDMLPAVLSSDLCSLLGGVDRSVNATSPRHFNVNGV